MKSRSIVLACIATLALLEGCGGGSPKSILFVGNSYTFGRLDPVLSYNAGNVTDLTRPRPDLADSPFNNPAGSNPCHPHPWVGVPGIFTNFTDPPRLKSDASISAPNAQQ